MTRSGNDDAGLWEHSFPTCVELSIDGRAALLRLNRPESSNNINTCMVAELWETSVEVEVRRSVLMFEGRHEVFYVEADLSEYFSSEDTPDDPGSLYRLWVRIAISPLFAVVHIHGRVMTGGVGFITASDIAICSVEATLVLSELLFGLYPTMVLPFLIRRIGRQHTHCLTCITQPIGAQRVGQRDLVDEATSDTKRVLGRYLLRLIRIPSGAIQTYKSCLDGTIGPICEHEVRTV